MRRGRPIYRHELLTRADRGFTLLELLVVVVLIGIILSFATLSLPNGAARQLAQEAERLHVLLGLAAEEAVLNNQEIGLHLSENGYAFYTHNGEDWQPLKDDPELRPRELPPGLRLALEIEGRPADHTEQPQIVLSASGEITLFHSRLSATAQSTPAYLLSADPAGHLHLELLGYEN